MNAQLNTFKTELKLIPFMCIVASFAACDLFKGQASGEGSL